jgi:triacylglycerol lipase
MVALLSAAGVVVVALTVIIVASHRGRGSSHPAAQNVPGPVLLVPGYGGSTTSLQPLADRLGSIGRTVDVVALPDKALGDLAGQAKALNAAAVEELKRTGARSVDVVGYSAGGVVARLWVRSYGGASLARRVISLGSPQHGTELASVGSLLPSACPTACQQLATGSSILAALNAGDETPAGPQFLSLWTTHDDVVVPPDSAELAGAVNLTVQSLCASDTVDHSGLPGDPVVQRIVIAALGVTLAAATPGCART